MVLFKFNRLGRFFKKNPARLHGAGHQQVQRDYVIIEKTKVNEISKNIIVIRLFTTTNWPELKSKNFYPV